MLVTKKRYYGVGIYFLINLVVWYLLLHRLHIWSTAQFCDIQKNKQKLIFLTLGNSTLYGLGNIPDDDGHGEV